MLARRCSCREGIVGRNAYAQKVSRRAPGNCALHGLLATAMLAGVEREPARTFYCELRRGIRGGLRESLMRLRVPEASHGHG